MAHVFNVCAFTFEVCVLHDTVTAAPSFAKTQAGRVLETYALPDHVYRSWRECLTDPDVVAFLRACQHVSVSVHTRCIRRPS